MDQLTGKNIVITGASSGIGKALTIAAVQVGANVAIAARNLENLNDLK
ncbi:MAG: SDR family NAD(P)-dependent oxidoreductase, partial [Bacteroidia bacterium]